MPSVVKDWCAMLNNYTEAEYANLVEECQNRQLIKYAIIGKEVGESGTPHLQMFFQFCTRRTMITVKHLLNNNCLHLEQRRGTAQEASEYCKKDNDFVEFGTISIQGQRNDLRNMVVSLLNKTSEEQLLEQFGDGYVQYCNHVKATTKAIIAERNSAAIKQQMEAQPLHPWQQVIFNALRHRPDPRKILWIWDATGNKGKSYLATYLAVIKDAFVTSNGKSADIKFAYNGQSIVVFDFSRTQQEQINYQVIEEIKNRCLFSSKYISEMRVFAIPHVICMANFQPNRDALSRDRWLTVDLDSLNDSRLQALLAQFHNMDLVFIIIVAFITSFNLIQFLSFLLKIIYFSKVHVSKVADR